MKTTVTFNGKTITIDSDTEVIPEYRSQFADPKHWWSQEGADEEGNVCNVIWREKQIDGVFITEHPDFTGDFDNICDWANPDDVISL